MRDTQQSATISPTDSRSTIFHRKMFACRGPATGSCHRRDGDHLPGTPAGRTPTRLFRRHPLQASAELLIACPVAHDKQRCRETTERAVTELRRTRRIVRRQRLLQLFLSQSLGTDWNTAADEAWRLEPAASSELIDRIDIFLNHPEYDLHGAPIPRSDGSVPEQTLIPLTDSPLDVTVRVTRVIDQSVDLLNYLGTTGVAVSSEVTVRSISVEGRVVTLDTARGRTAIGHDVAAGILVRIAPQP